MLVKLVNKLKYSIAVLLMIGSFVVTAPALASTYGSSSYNQCNYNGIDCVKTSSTTADSATPAGSGTVINLDSFSSFTDGTGKSTTVSEGTVFEFVFALDSPDKENPAAADSAANTITERHTITINSVTADSVVITVASSPKQFTLKLNQPLLIDVDGNGSNDIGVEVTSLTPPTAVLKIWKLTLPATTTAASTTPVAKVRSAWVSLSLIIASMIILLLLPRKVFIKIASLWGIKSKGGKGDSGKTGGLSDHIPTQGKPTHHNPLGLPAHDLHSQAGVVVNDEEIVKEEPEQAPENKVVVKDEEYEDIDPKK